MTKPTFFLDIDGVLHPTNAPYLTMDGAVRGEGLFRWLPKLQEALAKFPDVQVVLHSSWRFCWDTDEEVRSHLPPELNAMIVATTGREVMGRYESIQEYVKVHNIEKYVIVDDDGNAFPYGVKELVNCMSTQGLSRQNTYTKLITKLGEISEHKPEPRTETQTSSG